MTDAITCVIHINPFYPGIALNSTDESVGISTDAFKLSIETSAPQFKPFMGFSGFVSAKMPDETPVAGKEILVKIDLKDKLIQRNVTTDASVMQCAVCRAVCRVPCAVCAQMRYVSSVES